MERKLNNAPLKEGVLMCVQRAGVILNNFSIALFVAAIAVLLAILFSVLWGLVYVFLVLIDILFVAFAVVFTFGIIFLVPEGMSTVWFVDDIAFLFNPETVVTYIDMALPYMPYVFGGILLFAVLSLSLLLIDRNNISVPRVVWSILVIVTTIIIIALLLVFALSAANGGGL